jgi:hypothetical protein
MSQQPDPTKTAEMLVDHYQKTYEVTYELWNARNRLFPTLAAVIGGAAFLALRLPGADSLFVAVIRKIADLDETTQQALQQGVTYQILQTVLMVVVFHLLLDLYRHTQDITRNYKYMAGLEDEIRQALGFSGDKIAFTRENIFYQRNRVKLLGGVRYVYSIVLGVLLALFLYARISDDFHIGNFWFTAADIIIAIPIILYFVDYMFPGLLNRNKK